MPGGTEGADDGGGHKREHGLISTFQVALPEGTESLTIRHRSMTVEVGSVSACVIVLVLMLVGCTEIHKHPHTPMQPRASAHTHHTNIHARAHTHTHTHTHIHTQPPESQLHRLMGAAVWPAALGTIQVLHVLVAQCSLAG